MPSSEKYELLHTANLVGLFTCIFVKSRERPNIWGVNAAEVKLGMGGLHGNKVRYMCKARGWICINNNRAHSYYAWYWITALSASSIVISRRVRPKLLIETTTSPP